MKKKTKSSSRVKIYSRFEIIRFLIALLICLLFICGGSYIFYRNITKIVIKEGEKPVAQVTGKIKISRRCFEKRNVWDILKKNSLIYNYDIICTEPNSQTTLLFNNGVELTLSESTMTQIIVGEGDQLNIKLTSGNVLVDSSSMAPAATILYNNSKVSMHGKALVSAAEIKKKQAAGSESSEKPELEIQVLDGKAEIDAGTENKVELKNGQMVRIKKEKETVISKPALISETKDASSVTVMVNEQKPFESKSKAADKADAAKKLFAENVKNTDSPEKMKKSAADRNTEVFDKLQKKIEEAESGKEIKPAVKKVPAKPKSAAPSSKKTPLSAPQLLRPAAGKILNDNYFVENQKIVFVWNAVPGATNYKFVIKDGSGKVLKDRLLGKETSFTLTDLSILSNGKTLYWSVQALTRQNGTTINSSETRRSYFTVKLGEISGNASISGSMYGR